MQAKPSSELLAFGLLLCALAARLSVRIQIRGSAVYNATYIHKSRFCAGGSGAGANNCTG